MVGSALLAVMLVLLAIVFVAVAARVALRELRALVPVTPRSGVDVDALLVVIPARDEAARIGPTLRALLAEPGTFDVVVVDDRSCDGTADVVRALAQQHTRLRLLALMDEPPPGVFGKPRALQAALEDALARGPLPPRVLLLDADVELAPGALAGLTAASDGCGVAVFSGVPRLVCETMAEQLFVPALVSVVTGRFPPSRVHRPDDQTAFLNGQLILADTAALMAAGGFVPVMRTVLEDVALARHLKAHGLKLGLGDLRAVARTRMYTSWAEIRAGFGKNAVALLGPHAGLVGLLAFATSLLPGAALVAALDSGRSDVIGAVSLGVAGVVAAQGAVRVMAGIPVWPVLVLPVVYLGVAVVLGRASLQHLVGAPVAWRGRRYPGESPASHAGREMRERT